MMMNEYGEFVDDFDPYGIERMGAYHDVLGNIAAKGCFIETCPECGTPFDIYNGRKYCSTKCYEKAKRRRHRERIKEMNNGRD